ncbi:MAG TPA: elongation factor G [Rhodobacteraceae bacterium]|nr:elongation factor G [Paracoccaceae bacterium]
MPTSHPSSPRTALICGPYQSGKSSLFEALLAETGSFSRHGDGLSLADQGAEAKARQMSTEMNVASAEYLGEGWTFIDCPGSVELMQEARGALNVADIAVVVVEPEAEKARALAGWLKMLDAADVPHMLFINKFDRPNLSLRALMQAFQGVSAHPLVLREVPIRDGDRITGHVDLVSERAFAWQEGAHSALISLPETVADREAEARTELLESLADFDDGLLEKLLEDVEPKKSEVYENMVRDLAENLVVPVFFGSASAGHGILRLMKALRHDAPDVTVTATRLDVAQDGTPRAQVFKTMHAGHAGKVSLARVLSGRLEAGDHLAGVRPSGMNRVFGGKLTPVGAAIAGDVVALTKMEEVATGDLLTPDSSENHCAEPLVPLFGLAIRAEKRGDEVKLPEALRKLIDEDPSLTSSFDDATGEHVLRGQGDTQLRLALEKLKSRFGLKVKATTPRVAFRETIRKPVTKKYRHRKQSGGHGEFGEVELKLRPLARGEGFRFTESIHGGVVPKQYHPAVEAGVLDAMEKGPMGNPVVDVAVELTDGKHHSVDSSEMAFRKAAATTMRDALAEAGPVMLEPVNAVRISVPDEHIAAIQKIVTARRGQIFGLEAKEGWEGWEEVVAQMPAAEMHDLIIEIRSVTQGAGSFTSEFDHMQEISPKEAERLQAAQ